MAVLTDIMANGIQPIYESLCSYLKSSPASVTFSLFFSAVAILNIIRGILIWYEKKSMASNQRCKYLITNQSSSDCSIPSYWQWLNLLNEKPKLYDQSMQLCDNPNQ